MDSEISESVEILKDLSKIPSASSALILPNSNNKMFCIHSLWSFEDLVKPERTTFIRDYLVEKSNLNTLSSGIVTDRCNNKYQAFSESGKRQAILQEKKEKEEKTFLEIWTESQLEKTFDLTDRKEHGKITKKDSFGSFQWSANEKFLLYIAESKQPKSVSYFKETEKKEVNENTVKGEENLYREDWGEKLNGVHHTVLCVLEVETGIIQIFSMDDEDTELSIGQAIWGPRDESIVFIGWKEAPYRLGIYACTNRRTGMYVVTLEKKKYDLLSIGDDISVHSPHFSPNFEHLIYLENRADGTHRKCAKLQMLNWETRKVKTVVDIVDRVEGDGFPGIYETELPKRCWSEDGKHVYLSTVWRSRVSIICISIHNGVVQRIETGEEFGAARLLDVKNNLLVAQLSSPDIEPCLVVGYINEKNPAKIDWKFLDANTPVKRSDIQWSIIRMTPSMPNAIFSDLDYDIVVVNPSKLQEKHPLIIIPHGGPHSCYPVAFMVKVAAYVKLGFIVCLVNYRGSIGFGEDNVNSLPGNVGIQDVADVHDAALYVKNKLNFNISDVFAYGGSHGGFLSAHLCGQFPDFYKAAVLLNPVIDISAMISITDIPDWCFVEGGCGDLDFSSVPQPDQFKCMWEKSPIKHVKNVRAPTLLLLGKKDARVPMTQGMLFYHHLKARKVPVKAYHYDDNHSLFETQVAAECAIHTIIWFKQHSSHSI